MNRRVFLRAAAASGVAYASGGMASASPGPAEQDENTIRALLADGFETSWNNHRPADVLTSDKCMDDAVFINTTGGWVQGREKFMELITRLHGPGGPFHDHTRRHAVEELHFIRPDVAFAVVKTFDIKRGAACRPRARRREGSSS
jgi:hypothetical protein